MPASTLRSLRSLRSRRTESERRENPYIKKKKNKKKTKTKTKTQSFSRLTKKQTGPFQDHPTPPRGETLKSKKRNLVESQRPF